MLGVTSMHTPGEIHNMPCDVLSLMRMLLVSLISMLLVYARGYVPGLSCLFSAPVLLQALNR